MYLGSIGECEQTCPLSDLAGLFMCNNFGTFVLRSEFFCKIFGFRFGLEEFDGLVGAIRSDLPHVLVFAPAYVPNFSAFIFGRSFNFRFDLQGHDSHPYLLLAIRLKSKLFGVRCSLFLEFAGLLMFDDS